MGLWTKWSRPEKKQVGSNADETMWNTGVETPSAILCGLLATKIVNCKLDPKISLAPETFVFPLSSEPKRSVKVVFSSYSSEFNKVEVYGNSGRLMSEEPSFNQKEREIFQKAYLMLKSNLEKLHAAWLVEQNQNKALKLIEGLVDGQPLEKEDGKI